jgi:hypothetical protein
MAAGPISERNQDATIYVGGLDEKVTNPILHIGRIIFFICILMLKIWDLQDILV